MNTPVAPDGAGSGRAEKGLFLGRANRPLESDP